MKTFVSIVVLLATGYICANIEHLDLPNLEVKLEGNPILICITLLGIVLLNFNEDKPQTKEK